MRNNLSSKDEYDLIAMAEHSDPNSVRIEVEGGNVKLLNLKYLASLWLKWQKKTALRAGSE